MISDLDHELVDDVSIVQALLERDLPIEAAARGYTWADGISVVSEITRDQADKLPTILYELEGDDDWSSNGPGLWHVRMVVTAFTHGYDENWDLCKTVHAVISKWNIPGQGFLVDKGGFEYVDTTVKFTRSFVRDMFGKTVEQSEAIYSALIRTI